MLKKTKNKKLKTARSDHQKDMCILSKPKDSTWLTYKTTLLYSFAQVSCLSL